MFKPIPELAEVTQQIIFNGPDGCQMTKTVPIRESTGYSIRNGIGNTYNNLRNFLFFTWPEFTESIEVKEDKRVKIEPSNQWNPWLDRLFKTIADDSYAVKRGRSKFKCMSLTGCASAGKTFFAGLYATMWWGVAPEKSIVILTSTTRGMIRQRAWPVISHFHSTAMDPSNGNRLEVGRMIDSEMKIVNLFGDGRKDHKHCIMGQAVAHGETQKAIHNLKGQHAERMLVVIDEANGTPEAIMEVVNNWRKACRDFTLIVIGNPGLHNDPHGRVCEPANGWSAVNIDTEQWLTKGVPEWSIDKGICLRFDGAKSPNIPHRVDPYPYIYTKNDWENAQIGEKTLSYWTQDRGLWPPEGFTNTVFTEQFVERCDAMGHFEFHQSRIKMAFLDTAFGGDSCILQFGELGDVGMKQALQLTDWIDVPIAPDTLAQDIDYQIARYVVESCRRNNVQPHCFGCDATGTGRGVAAIIASEWSQTIQRTEWGTGATERPSSLNDNRPSKEVYANFVTEMWWFARDATETGQLKGFSRGAISEACTREYKMTGKKYQIESKEKLKNRVKYSPDHFDAVAGLCEVARRNGFELTGTSNHTVMDSWQQEVRKMEEKGALYSDDWVEIGSEGGWGVLNVWD